MRADSSYVQLSLLSVIALHAMLQKEGAHTNSWILSFERRRLCTSLGSVLCLIINLLLAAFQCSSCCIKYWLHAVFSGGNQTKICAPPHFTWLSCPPPSPSRCTDSNSGNNFKSALFKLPGNNAVQWLCALVFLWPNAFGIFTLRH